MLLYLTAQALAEIEHFAIGDFVTALPEGEFTPVTISPALFDRLQAIRAPDESFSDLILRLAAFYKGKGELN